MTESILGMQVIRAIPMQTSLCLATGKCVQHGGVIRIAAGHDGAGQIVKHLIFPRGTEALVPALAPPAPQLLTVASQTMALAQVSLAVSAVGFTVLFGMLIDIERKLGKIAREVQAITTSSSAASSPSCATRSSRWRGSIESVERTLESRSS